MELANGKPKHHLQKLTIVKVSCKLISFSRQLPNTEARSSGAGFSLKRNKVDKKGNLPRTT